ncbi:MAG TPA: glycosyltransferase [Chthoniobacterales bacterium]|nr:glycosyltransferase [Chthoniobacterales bacterium]
MVDFSCPQGSGEFVKLQFPTVRVVSVDGEDHFSNWAARNAGASAATADVLVFCDADTILADNAIAWLSDNLPDNAFGVLNLAKPSHLRANWSRLAVNQLRGFHAVPATAFREIGGYDEVLQGYAAGGDIDLVDRLKLSGLVRYPLAIEMIQSVVAHDDSDRMQHHADPVRISYCAGLLYRSAKLALLRLRDKLELTLASRRDLYEVARKAARALKSPNDSAGMMVMVEVEPIHMPRVLGYEKGVQKLSLKVEISPKDGLDSFPG